MARLILKGKGVDLVTHELVDDLVMIGRVPLNQIVIDHLTVSAHHAALLRVGDSYWLKDLNSTNGIQINGVVATEADLKDGDKISFGSVTAVFAGCSRKRSSTCAFKEFCTSSTIPKSEAAAEGDAVEKMEFNDSSKEKLGQIETLIQDATEEFYARKVMGESLLAHLDKEMRMDGRAMNHSAIDFWARHIRDLKDR